MLAIILSRQLKETFSGVFLQALQGLKECGYVYLLLQGIILNNYINV